MVRVKATLLLLLLLLWPTRSNTIVNFVVAVAFVLLALAEAVAEARADAMLKLVGVILNTITSKDLISHRSRALLLFIIILLH